MTTIGIGAQLRAVARRAARRADIVAIRVVRYAGLIALAGVAVSCAADQAGPVAPTGPQLEAATPAVSFGLWTPGPGECPKAVHDRYGTLGPDGKRYPTWHPPADPLSGCSFGHEHGRDPRGSALYARIGDPAFGYANEQLDAANLGMRRHEDHVGHKVEWENDVLMRTNGGAGALLEVRCDVLTKLHQGTHSRDAFTNNLHELNYHVRCTDRAEMHITVLTAIGRPGEFERTCGGTVQVGPATPVNSPNGDGRRKIPDWSCLESRVLVGAGSQSDFGALHESWETHTTIRTAEGNKAIASFDPYFQVFRPSRYFERGATENVGRPAALCTAHQHEARRARGNECDAVQQAMSVLTSGGAAFTLLPYDDARSPFNGVRRQIDINNNTVRNADGPTTWYTDPFGKNARTSPFPGSIRQYLSSTNNDYGVGVNGPTVGGTRSYGGPGVRAPN